MYYIVHVGREYNTIQNSSDAFHKPSDMRKYQQFSETSPDHQTNDCGHTLLIRKHAQTRCTNCQLKKPLYIKGDWDQYIKFNAQ